MNAEMDAMQKLPSRMFATQKICCKCDSCSVLCPKGVLTNDDPYRKNWARCDGCDQKQECQEQCPYGSLRMSTRVYIEGAPDNKIVCVFACPTDKENVERCPVVGDTGKKLHLLFEKLRDMGCDVNIEDVCIVNSSSVIHNSSDRDSVRVWEIEENLAVLYKYVFSKESEIVLLFGKMAALAWKKLLGERKKKGSPIKAYKSIRAIKSVHLSPKSMNAILPGRDVSLKLGVLARYIKRSLCSKSSLMEFEDYICAFKNQRRIKAEAK